MLFAILAFLVLAGLPYARASSVSGVQPSQPQVQSVQAKSGTSVKFRLVFHQYYMGWHNLGYNVYCALAYTHTDGGSSETRVFEDGSYIVVNGIREHHWREDSWSNSWWPRISCLRVQ